MHRLPRPTFSASITVSAFHSLGTMHVTLLLSVYLNEQVDDIKVSGMLADSSPDGQKPEV